MRKFQVLALTLITCVAFTAVANAEVSLVYYPADANSPVWGENGAGTLIADSTDRSITTLEIISAGGNFTPAGAAAGAFAPPFDIISETKLFKLSAGAGAYTNLNFGQVGNTADSSLPHFIEVVLKTRLLQPNLYCTHTTLLG